MRRSYNLPSEPAMLHAVVGKKVRRAEPPTTLPRDGPGEPSPEPILRTASFAD